MDNPQWKKGIVIRAFSSQPGFLAGTEFLTSLDDYSRVFQRARRSGFAGVQLYLEIAAGLLNLEASDDLLEQIARRARDEGIEFPSLEIAPLQYSFTADDAAERVRGVAVVRRAIEIAERLGCPGVLVIPGYVGKMWDPTTDDVYYEDAYCRTVDCLRQLTDDASRHGVDLLVEPIWNMFLLSPLEMRSLIDEVGSARCGVLLDTGNVTLVGFAEHWIRVLRSRVREIHLKDFRRQVGTIQGFVPLLAGDVRWAKVTAAARAAGYSGFWIAEQFPYAEQGDLIIQHTSAAMDRILWSRETDPEEGL